jgi:hypothetical protein
MNVEIHTLTMSEATPPIARLDDLYGPPGLRQYRALDHAAEAAWCPDEAAQSFEDFVAAGGVRRAPRCHLLRCSGRRHLSASAVH